MQLPDHSSIRDFRAFLNKHDYNTDKLTQRLGRARPPAPDEHQQMVDDSREITTANLLVRLFLLGAPVDAPTVAEFLPEVTIRFCEEAGFLETVREKVQARVVIVPVENLLGPEHGGFMIAQARLGPGRIHHCMRAIGMAERAFEIMCRHANTRVAFGGPIGEKQFVQEWIATSRMEIDQARLLTLYTAWKMDIYGKQVARQEISMIKVVVPNMLMNVLDRAIQCLGSLGISDDTPVAAMWREGRSLRIADGPDEVHKMVIARRELKRFA
ncbi:MAG: hypothetical protein IIB75_06920 [Proteobacteria bacterium]|nr:hypothetical protein [Pseudomonadota bacterium]